MAKGTSKYDPLRRYLVQHRKRSQILMTLGEIEGILGFALCKSATTPSWWANTQSDAGRSQRRAWGDAGYDAYLSASRDTVEFVRTAEIGADGRKCGRGLV